MLYIGIGSNLGNRIENIEKAKFLLKQSGINIIKSSSFYETLSWPDKSDPKYINIIIQSNTNIKPKKFLQISKSIENKLGRKKDYKNAPRSCDIDIISYGKKISSGDIEIPQKDVQKKLCFNTFI